MIPLAARSTLSHLFLDEVFVQFAWKFDQLLSGLLVPFSDLCGILDQLIGSALEFVEFLLLCFLFQPLFFLLEFLSLLVRNLLQLIF